MNNDKTPPHSSATKDQWIAAIEEHLATVRWCLDGSQHGGRIKGYSAALLLFCVIDAMGNGLLRPVNLAPAKDDKERWLSTRLENTTRRPPDFVNGQTRWIGPVFDGLRAVSSVTTPTSTMTDSVPDGHGIT